MKFQSATKPVAAPVDAPRLRDTPLTMEELLYARRQLFDLFRGEHEVARELGTTRQSLMGALVRQQNDRRESKLAKGAQAEPRLPEKVERARIAIERFAGEKAELLAASKPLADAAGVRVGPMKRIIVPINVASRYLEIADVLSYRLGSFASAPRGWLPCRLIEIAGRNPDVHTAVIDQDATHEWMVLGMRLGAQKLKLLSDEVRDNPGLIDVYRYLPLGEFDGDTPLESGTLPWTARRDICNQMRLFALRDRYGVANVIRAGLHLAAITRLFAPIESADRANSTRPYCSQAVAISYAERGYPLLNNRRPSETLPGDLVTSKKLELLCTLGPEVAEPEPLENYYDPKRHVEPVKPASWKFSIRGFWTGLGRPMPALATDH